MMSTPRYRPRDFVLPSDRGSFGKSTNLRWIPADEAGDRDQWFAAKLQHQAAMTIAHAVYGSDRSIKSYALEAGVAYQRLSQVLRGDVVMRFEDMATAQRVLGVKFLG